ncbi:MAG: lipoprotein-releasing ABC transporter permease subunit [Paraglaciecola sp.]|uniref:lipoprotein-releasing ABC transporter permease subunit n=1 Tax=Paraglaciecola sp. TaxID=1920173 RepID=UPI003263C9E7
MRLIWLLAWRFRSNKRQNGFISFISASSTFGVGLGCFVLILLLSVMNGFENELKERLLSIIPHAEYKSVYRQGIDDWKDEIALLKAHPRVTFVEPYVKVTGMLQKGNKMKAVDMTGLELSYAATGFLPEIVSTIEWQEFMGNTSGVILGKGLLENLSLNVGDKVQILLPQLTDDLSLRAPKSLTLEVVGSIELGGELSNHTGFMHMSLAAETQNITNGAQGIRLRFDEPFEAQSLTKEIGYGLQSEVYMSNWTISDGNLYQDIQLVRAVVYIALTLVIAVACFNIVSSLVMAVNEKQSEIAMLKSIGADNGLIILVFMMQGTLNGVIGTLCGAVLGVIFSLYLADISLFIENLFGVQFLSGDVYFIDFLPSKLEWHDVYLTVFIAMGLSILATIYPAVKAAKVNPAKVLGH